MKLFLLLFSPRVFRALGYSHRCLVQHTAAHRTAGPHHGAAQGRDEEASYAGRKSTVSTEEKIWSPTRLDTPYQRKVRNFNPYIKAYLLLWFVRKIVRNISTTYNVLARIFLKFFLQCSPSPAA